MLREVRRNILSRPAWRGPQASAIGEPAARWIPRAVPQHESPEHVTSANQNLVFLKALLFKYYKVEKPHQKQGVGWLIEVSTKTAKETGSYFSA